MRELAARERSHWAGRCGRAIPALLLLALALASAPEARACRAPPDAAREGGGRGARFEAGQHVLIAPFNLPVALPKELRGKTSPVGEALVGYLERRGVGVDALPAEYAHGLWMELRDELAAERPGRVPDLDAVCAGLARRLAERERFDYLLVPTLVPRLAPVRRERARWDGVEREIVLRGAPGSRRIEGQANSSLGFRAEELRGRVGAASLHLAVLAPDGELVYDGIGGLSLLHEARGTGGLGSGSLGVELVVREQPFERGRELREGIRIAFERRLSTALPGRP